jgi:hypothetical protein
VLVQVFVELWVYIIVKEGLILTLLEIVALAMADPI